MLCVTVPASHDAVIWCLADRSIAVLPITSPNARSDPSSSSLVPATRSTACWRQSRQVVAHGPAMGGLLQVVEAGGPAAQQPGAAPMGKRPLEHAGRHNEPGRQMAR